MTSSSQLLALPTRKLDLSQAPMLMGIINVTTNSFSDGGRYLDPGNAVRRGIELWRQGAQLLDVGGESTRPGALPVAAEEEIKRVVPVIAGIKAATGAVISVDTYRAATAKAAIAAGAEIINDISACSDKEMLPLAVRSKAALVLMHMQATPATMQNSPGYNDVTAEIITFLQNRAKKALRAGVDKSAIIFDPGIGFGKTQSHNLQLMRDLKKFTALGYPVLLGVSRKSFLANFSGQKFGGTGTNLAANLWALSQGVKILRVHEVEPLKQASAFLSTVSNYLA
jgi:dihydropteroate synthase